MSQLLNSWCCIGQGSRILSRWRLVEERKTCES
jgi:hypothetical protein